MLSSPKSQVPAGVLICYSAMDKAIKTLNLYSGKGPLVEAGIEALRDSLQRYLGEHERLDLEVTAHGLAFEGSSLEIEGQPAPYYFYLFKDGMREISFLSGITEEQLQSLLQIMLDRHADAGGVATDDEDESFRDHDTVTMMWEADMTHVRYYAIDAYAAGEVFDPDRGMRRSLEELVQDRMRPFRSDGKEAVNLRAARPVAGLEGGTPVTAPQTADARILEALKVEAENDEAFQMDRFAVVWARLVKTAPPDQLRGMTYLMVKTFEVWMGDQNWGALNRGLRLLQSLSSVETLNPVVREIVRAIAEPERLGHLANPVLKVDPEEVPRVTSFFGALGQRSVQHLARMLADLEPGSRCDTYASHFEQARWGSHNLHLARLNSSSMYIAQDALRRLVPVRNLPGVAEALRKLLERPEIEMRYEALRALEGDKDEVTCRAVRRALADGSRDLRALAIRILGNTPAPWALEALTARVHSKEFKALQSTERRLLLISYATVADKTVLGWFDEELDRQSLFGAKKLQAWQDELRRALQEAGTPETLALLAADSEGYEDEQDDEEVN